MAKALGPDGGEIGLVFHAADFFVTKQRYDGFKATIASDYPNIKIVEEQGIGGPDFSGDAEKAAGAMLTANPNIKGIWAVWDVPAEGVMAAARANGRDDLIITTVDLGENVAISMAQGGFMKALAHSVPMTPAWSRRSWQATPCSTRMRPTSLALPALPVSKDNLLDAWKPGLLDRSDRQHQDLDAVTEHARGVPITPCACRAFTGGVAPAREGPALPNFRDPHKIGDRQ